MQPKFTFTPRSFLSGGITPDHEIHELDMPKDSHEAMAAIQFMMSNYNDVQIEHGERLGAPYCKIRGKPRK